LKPQNEIHPAPLLISFAAFQIGSPLRGDGDAVDNFFTAPRLTAPGQGRMHTRHVGRFFGPLNSFWGCSHNKKFMPAAGAVWLFGLFFLISLCHVRQGRAPKTAAVTNLAVGGHLIGQ
jgi:hypothetical protein